MQDDMKIEKGSMHTIRWSKVIIAVIGIAVILAICAYVGHSIPVRRNYVPLLTPKTKITAPTPSPILTPTQSLTTSTIQPGWQTYIDEEDHVTFQYPQGWEMHNGAFENQPNSHITKQAVFIPKGTLVDSGNQISYTVFNYTTIQSLTDSMGSTQSNTYKDNGTISINGRDFYNITISDHGAGETQNYYIFLTKTGKAAEIVTDFTNPLYTRENISNLFIATVSY